VVEGGNDQDQTSTRFRNQAGGIQSGAIGDGTTLGYTN